ncbi:MAG: hypothetical protein ACI9OJ_003574 [Myxococcota bacterium]|jgi:hypothetical protein
MAQQKSDSRIVSKGPRKLASNRGVESSGGEKAATVTGDDCQLTMSFATAEKTRNSRETESARKPNLIGGSAQKGPKADANPSPDNHAWINRVIGCLPEARL